MKAAFFFALIVHLFCASPCRGQDSIAVREVVMHNSTYKDFVISGKTLYGLTKGDSLIIWDIRKERVDRAVAGITAVAKGNNGKILCSISSGEILEVSGKKEGKMIMRSLPNAMIYNMVIDSEGHPALITNKGMFYKDSLYVPPPEIPVYNKMGNSRRTNAISRPNVVFLDGEQRVWLGYDRGEWDGDLCFFSLENKQFTSGTYLDLKYMDKYAPKNDTLSYYQRYKTYMPTFTDLQNEYPDDIKMVGSDTLKRLQYVANFNHLQGVAQDRSGNLLVSNCPSRSFIGGDLILLKGDGVFYKSIRLKSLLRHKLYINPRTNKTRAEVEEEPQAITLNPYDKSIYYYSNDGFFKLIEEDGSYRTQFILAPYINWVPVFPNAGHYRVRVPKFEFVSRDKFVFLTNSNGIGYYNGREVVYFR